MEFKFDSSLIEQLWTTTQWMGEQPDKRYTDLYYKLCAIIDDAIEIGLISKGETV